MEVEGFLQVFRVDDVGTGVAGAGLECADFGAFVDLPNFDNGGLSEYAYTPGQTGPAGDGVTFGGLRQAGSPWSSAAKAQRHYANSPAANVTKWHTPILCIHGMMDYRIPYDQGMAAFNAAQMMGVPSKLVVFPNENHWILQPQNALFWHRTYFDWLDRWMK